MEIGEIYWQMRQSMTCPVLPAGHQEKIWPAAWGMLSTAEYVIPGQQMGGVFLS